MNLFPIVGHEAHSSTASQMRIQCISRGNFVVVNASQAKTSSDQRVLLHRE